MKGKNSEMEKKDMCFEQQLLEKHATFSYIKEKAPDRTNSKSMTASDIRNKIQKGIDDVELGKVSDLKTIIRKG